jgi:DNA ligase-1
MGIIKRPMLADQIESVNDLRFPLMASPKLDGLRCLMVDGRAMTRNFNPISNQFIREWLEEHCPDGLDGELMVRNADGFSQVSGDIRRADGKPNFVYNVFDYVTNDINEPFNERYAKLVRKVASMKCQQVELVLHTLVENQKDLSTIEATAVRVGYEGVMVRSLDGPYKFGRSTVKEGYLLKIKRFKDSEAVILELSPMMHNDNEAEEDAFGRTKRASNQENKVEMNTLGKFTVKDIHTGQVFDIGTGRGLTQEVRKQIWENRSKYKGKIIKYKYQECGTKDLPRFPVWLGFRGKE